MTDFPSDWALKEASRRVPGIHGGSDISWVKFTYSPGSVLMTELARMIEKYEPHTRPVDPDVLAVREILSVVVTYGEAVLRGEFDQDGGFLKALEIYGRHARQNLTYDPSPSTESHRTTY